jgi:hypothetical protein
MLPGSKLIASATDSSSFGFLWVRGSSNGVFHLSEGGLSMMMMGLGL